MCVLLVLRCCASVLGSFSWELVVISSDSTFVGGRLLRFGVGECLLGFRCALKPPRFGLVPWLFLFACRFLRARSQQFSWRLRSSTWILSLAPSEMVVFSGEGASSVLSYCGVASGVLSEKETSVSGEAEDSPSVYSPEEVSAFVILRSGSLYLFAGVRVELLFCLLVDVAFLRRFPSGLGISLRTI